VQVEYAGDEIAEAEAGGGIGIAIPKVREIVISRPACTGKADEAPASAARPQWSGHDRLGSAQRECRGILT